jgi:Protein of unknown function (DUF3185)
MMNAQRIVGVALFIIGGILFMVAMSSSQSVVDQVSSTVTGRFTQATTWYFVGGASAAILGLLMIILGPRRRSA